MQVLSASSEVHEQSPLSADRSAHLAAIRNLAPGATRLDLGDAMTSVDRLAATLPAPVTLHIVSDFQDSGLPARFADLVSTRVASLQTYLPLSVATSNWSIEAIRQSADGVDVVVNAVGEGDMTNSIALTVNGSTADRRNIEGPGVSIVNFTGLALEPGDNRVQVEVTSGDDLEIDNSRYLVIRNEPPAPIPLLTFNRGGLPVTYLSAALHSDPHGRYRVEPVIIGDFDPRTLSRSRWLIIDDIGSVDTELGETLAGFVRDGGGILAFVGRRSASATVLPLLGNPISGASMAPDSGRFLSIGQVDTGHPLLAETDGWYAVNISQSVPVVAQPDDQVLVRLENQEPFLLERRRGQGRVLLVAGDLENRWNDLPTRPVFVSSMIEAARYLSGSEQVIDAFMAGSTLPLSLVGGISGQVVDPQGNTVLSLAGTTQAQQIQMDQTGFYEVYTSQGNYLAAVNVDPRESQLAMMPPENLQRWAAAMSGPADAAGLSTFEQQVVPVELWHALLFILALVLIGESMLANWYLTPKTSGGSN
jgi:hypothetical protein